MQLAEWQRQLQQQQNLMQQQAQQVKTQVPKEAMPNITFLSTIGALSEFNIGEDWNLYQERLGQYFVANQVSQERKVAVLITLVGQEAYKILKDLCDSTLLECESYEELCEILKKQFAPRVSVFKERIEFYELKQKEKESVNEWFARIKSKAINCKFGAQLDDKIKDRFVTGLSKGRILDRVCEEEHTTTLQSILEVARKKEAALALSSKASLVDVHNLKSRKAKSAQQVTFQKKKKEEKTGSQHQGSKEEPKCVHCGGTRHIFAKCKYKTYKCKICSKEGHLAKICKNNKSTVANTNYLESGSNDKDTEIVDMYNLSNVLASEEPLIVKVEIEGKSIAMELDTGAGKSILPEKIFKEKFSHCKLENTKIRLRMYNGSILIPEGQISVNIKCKETVIQAQLIVVKKGNRILMGRDLMKLLNIKMEQINSIKEEDNLKALLQEYKELFNNELGKYKFEKIDLKLSKEANPIFIKPRPIPLAFKEKISKQLEELEKKGVIEPIDTSAWGTPLVPVIKKDGSIRICADYKITVNKFLEDVKHPLPRIEELFTALSGGESFTKLDLTAAYNQLEVTERTSRLLAWSTHKIIYSLKRLPFGTKPACSIFQRTIEKVLQGVKNVINFIDDIVVTGANKEEHLKNLREVFKRLSEAGFKINLKKSVFFQPEIKYLGHVINKEGLHKDPEKVAAMLEAPKPKNVSEVKAFVGMVNYYGKFVPNLSQVLTPLYELQRSTTFKWTQQCEEAFNNVKSELASERNLVHFNKKWKLKLVCDASKVGIGAVLLHVLPDSTEKPIAFASRVLHDAEKNYSVIHKEALAIYWAICKFYQYLMGNEFILCSDHKPLMALFGEHKGIPQMAAGRLQRWALFLSGFQYKFEHIKGIQNGGADGLSRLPRPIKIKEAEVEDYFHFVTAERTPIDATQIKKELRKDNILSKVYLYTRDGWPNSVSEEIKVFASKANEIGIENDILMWGYRVIVPFKFRKALLEEIHGAHLGMAKMKMIARQYFWWPNIDKEIEEYVKECEACRTTANNPNKSPLIKFQEAEFPFDRIHIDFAGPFKGKTYLIVVDAFTKWPEVFEMSNTNTESTIEKLRECFARFGLPRMIFSDNGRQFVSEEFENFCKNNGIKHRTSAPYHPSTNGLAENAVGSFKKGLSKALADKRNASLSTTTLINRYLASYRNAPHTSIGESPSKLMFGREIRTRLSLLNRPERDKAREKQVQYFKGNREILLKPGDIVYVRDYKIPTKPTWRKAIIKSKIGNRTYVCKTLDSEELIWKRHIEQIIEAGKFYSEEEDCMSKSDKDNKKSDSKELEVVQEPEKDNVCESPEETKTDINVKPKRIIRPVQRLNL
ncbi:uncharacterized protein K02A2.6-like [Solenopsis invicta]|uniref:uncharacterized protein K02A2.6-like n=1 Tax=Solenopsis invicta TaxID=13686 RepID=UPI00193E088E|nr:uncharacterized protein K02A2.6-like [Solenopsis invicta]